MQTIIAKWGNSQGIRLPKHLLDSLGLARDDVVEVIAKDDSIIIKKTHNKKLYQSIEELFKDFDGEYEPIEIDWEMPVGKEVW